ncbi:VOC family protein [Dactylosporangium sp. CA-139066]|uniref:VOC family protein n=1 Tax=Dactylosporangium sp. CA-139066 TaxID=3239930 RepID=UPI003D8E664B
MDFVSIRIISHDVARLVAFYERATGIAAEWATEDFAQLRTGAGTVAIGSTRTVRPEAARAGENRSVIVEFLVDDVDALYERLRDRLDDVVQEPATMPWGNRSLLVRDPDGNLVNFFRPATSGD